MAIYDFFLSRNNAGNITVDNYIGHEGRLFYDSDTGEIRLSDGVTPGGSPIPVTVATASTAGSVRPGDAFFMDGEFLKLDTGDSLTVTDSALRLLPGTSDTIGGIKAGPGVIIAADGTLTIDSSGLTFNFGDFIATTATLEDSSLAAVLQSRYTDEDIVLQSNGDGEVAVIGTFGVYTTNGNVSGALAEESIFRVKQDGQVRILVPLADSVEGGMEIIGSDLGTSLAPGLAGTMIHLTGNADLPTRVYHDTLGGYSSYVFRRYNGSVITPTQVLDGEAVARINFTAATDAGMGNVSLAQIRISAIEDQTTTAQGSEVQFFVTPEGSPASSRISALDIRAAGVTSNVGFIGNLTGTASSVTNGVYTTDTGTVTNTMLAGSIANDKLANSTISGVALGSNLLALTAGSYLTSNDGTYNGSAALTFAVDATTAATADKVVARDANASIAAATTSFATRQAGSFGVGQTLTIDMATDKYVHANITGETVTVAYTNITAGKEIYIFFTNATGGDLAVNSGIADTNATNAKGTENVKNGGTSQIRVTSFGTTVNDCYVHFKK